MLQDTIEFEAEIRAVDALNRWLAEAVATAGLDRGVADDLKLCLHEIVSNIILHGQGSDRRIQVDLQLSDDTATATVIDRCQAFDPTARPLADKIRNLETAQIGGFGITLVRTVAETVRYARAGGANVLTLTCRRR